MTGQLIYLLNRWRHALSLACSVCIKVRVEDERPTKLLVDEWRRRRRKRARACLPVIYLTEGCLFGWPFWGPSSLAVAPFIGPPNHPSTHTSSPLRFAFLPFYFKQLLRFKIEYQSKTLTHTHTVKIIIHANCFNTNNNNNNHDVCYNSTLALI